MRVVACCSRGSSLGIRPGMALAQAEALAPEITVHAGGARDVVQQSVHQPLYAHALVRLAEQDAALVSVRGRVLALRRSTRMERTSLHTLALSFERWMPVAAIDGADAIVGDLRGCAALFRTEHGTERRFLASIRAWLAAQGLRVHAVIASTVGTALAVARHALHPHQPIASIPEGAERATLAPLPLVALRADPATMEALLSVDVHTVGQLAALGRQGVAARFATQSDGKRHASRKAPHATPHPAPRAALLHSMCNVLDRFDQAIGLTPEVLAPVRFIRRVRVEQVFSGPVLVIETVLLAVASVLDQVCATLSHDGLLLRTCALHFDRADIPTLRVPLHLGQPTTSRARIWALLRPQLERMQLGYGVLGVSLVVARVEPARMGCTPNLLDIHASINDQSGKGASRAPMDIDDVMPVSLFAHDGHGRAHDRDHGSEGHSGERRMSLGALLAEGAITDIECAPGRLRMGEGTFAQQPVLSLIDTVRARCGEESTRWMRRCENPAVPWRAHDPFVDPHTSSHASSHAPSAPVIVAALRPTVMFTHAEPLLWRGMLRNTTRSQCVQSAICDTPWDGLIELHWRNTWRVVQRVAGFERMAAPWWRDEWRDKWRDASASTAMRTMAQLSHAEALKVSLWTALRVQLRDGTWLWVLWEDDPVQTQSDITSLTCKEVSYAMGVF